MEPYALAPKEDAADERVPYLPVEPTGPTANSGGASPPPLALAVVALVCRQGSE
eukprot:COSAG06_NODE_13506_length_1250_cov_2.928836_2_plen_53_part_01